MSRRAGRRTPRSDRGERSAAAGSHAGERPQSAMVTLCCAICSKACLVSRSLQVVLEMSVYRSRRHIFFIDVSSPKPVGRSAVRPGGVTGWVRESLDHSVR